jgi:molecular chaperone GrpE
MSGEHGEAADTVSGVEAQMSDAADGATEGTAQASLDADAQEQALESGAPATGAASLESEIEGLRAQLAQREDALLRVQAELENQRRRAQRDVENAHKFGVEKFVAELLPVKDSMELGLAAGVDADLGALREGLELTEKMLTSALEKFGVVQVDPQGDAFNPELHQAMSMQEGADIGPGKVVTVFQKGYLLNERLVRPAMVIVSK